MKTIIARSAARTAKNGIKTALDVESDNTSNLPELFEDEGQEEMGETRPHNTTQMILFVGIEAHLAPQQEYTVLGDMNLYYHPQNRFAYVSPDVMVVKTAQPLTDGLRTYRIGEQGPAPVLIAEVLSRRTAQQGDLTIKPKLYADLGVADLLEQALKEAGLIP